MFWILAWLGAAALFLAADFLWLGIIAKGLYRRGIGHLLAKQFRPAAAVAFYLVYVCGIVWFGIAGATTVTGAALAGALFGFFCYATYNLTNFATLRDWPLWVTVLDTSWGAAVTASASAAGFTVSRLAV